MVESAGKKLQQARLRKQISVEEAARVTRMRPDKILDLEEDNYSNFPSMSYAKGFLLIYAKFLGVDIRDFASTLQTPNPVSSGDDYEYLNVAASLPAAAPARRPYSHSFAPRRERSILPLVVAGVLILIVILGIYLFSISRRLESLDDLGDKKDASPAASGVPAISALPASPVALPVVPVAPSPAGTPASAAATPVPAPSSAAVPFANPPPALAYNPALEVRRAEPAVAASPAASASPGVAASPAPAATREITVRPLRKTRVTIRRDVADSAPVFEDWLYPTDGALKLSGQKFWIKVQDPGAVQVTRDGKPVPSGESEIRIE